MAIQFDSSTAPAYSGAATTVTFSHTCSGTDRILFVHGTGNQSPTSTLSATYNGVSMTEVNRSLDSVGTGVPTYLWYMINPPTGANNVVVTSSSNGVVGSAVSYTGVNQTTPIPESNATPLNTSTTSMTKSLTTTVNNSWLVMTFRTGSGSTLTAGAGTSVRTQPEIVAFGAGSFIDSNSALATGSNTLGVTCTSQFFGGQIIVSLSPTVISPSFRVRQMRPALFKPGNSK